MTFNKDIIWKWIKRNWYAGELTLVCFLLATAVIPLWAAWAAIFFPFMGWIISKIMGK